MVEFQSEHIPTSFDIVNMEEDLSNIIGRHADKKNSKGAQFVFSEMISQQRLKESMVNRNLTRFHHMLDCAKARTSLSMEAKLCLKTTLKSIEDVQKFWAYYQDEELNKLLLEAGFMLLSFDCVQPHHSYQSHPALRVFSQKG